jgi:hypothetical protein
LLAATLFPDPLSGELVEPILSNKVGTYDRIAIGVSTEAAVGFDAGGLPEEA